MRIGAKIGATLLVTPAVRAIPLEGSAAFKGQHVTVAWLVTMVTDVTKQKLFCPVLNQNWEGFDA